MQWVRGTCADLQPLRHTVHPYSPLLPPAYLQENPDLFKWLTGQLQPPEHMLGNPAFVVSGATWLLLVTTINDGP